MSSSLLKHVDAWQLCSKDRRFTGDITIDRFKRLAPLLCSSKGQAAFDLQFTHDENERGIIRGTISATIELACQRCLRPMAHSVSEEFVLGMVTDLEDVALLPDDVDPLLLENGQLDVADILEDELILAVPIVPMHRHDDCEMKDDSDGRSSATSAQRDNPFASLVSLKSKI